MSVGSTILNPSTGRAATQNVEFLSWNQIREFLKFEEIMKAIGIGVHCNYCTQAYGPPSDGIRMTIHDKTKEVTLECNHKVRRFKVQNPSQEKVVLGH